MTELLLEDYKRMGPDLAFCCNIKYADHSPSRDPAYKGGNVRAISV